MEQNVIKTILAMLLILASCQATSQVSEAQKKEFIELLKGIPHKGEFFTEEAITKAAPYLHILFALTEKDIEKYDIYPFVALSRGLCDQKDERNYAVRNFVYIRHPTLKLFWAVILFDAGVASDEVVQFLRVAIRNEMQTKLLSEMAGPKFEDLKRRVVSHPAADR